MIIKGPLKSSQNGVNYISDGHCCPTTAKFFIGLTPNEQSKTITDLIWTDGTCGSSIISAGYFGNAQPFPPLASNIALTDPTDPQDLAEVIVDLCGCGTVGDTFTIQLDIKYLLPTGPNTQTVYFDFEVIDHTTATVITVDDANFWDCNNDCGKIIDIVPITNPFSTDLEITFPDPLAGFKFYINNILLNPVAGVYTINVQGGSSVTLQVANPNCAVTTDTDFTLAFSYCGVTENVNVNHRIVSCNPCGIDCQGISLSSGFSQTIILDPNISVPVNWNPYGTFGTPLPSPVVSGGKLSFTGTSGGYNEVRLGYTPAVSYPTVTPITYKWKLRTGAWDINSANQIYVYTPVSFTSQVLLGPSAPVPSVIQPNKIYTGTFVIDPNVPGSTYAGNGPVLVLSVTNQLGKLYEILEWSLEAEQQSLVVDFDCSDLDPYNYTAIGDKITATYNMFYENGFQNGTELYFNPKLFGDDCNQFPGFSANGNTLISTPPYGWKAVINSSWINDGLWHGMGLFGLGPTGATQQNISVEVQIVDDWEFKIRFVFYMTMDVDNWITSASTLQNPERLLKNHYQNTAELVNDIDSVYNNLNGKLLCALIAIRDTVNSAPYLCGRTASVVFFARFWDKGPFNDPSEMTNPTWSFTRTVGNVTSLSTLEKTKVDFNIDYYNQVDTITFWLFNKRPQNTAQNFVANYDSSRSMIVDNPGTGVISNHLESPSTGPILVSGTTYNASCYISNNLDPNGDYYIGAICYSSTDGMVNSFLYHFDPVTNVPEICCDLLIFSQWESYNDQITSACYTTAPKERFNHKLYVYGGALQTCMINDWGMDPSTNWLDHLKMCYFKVYEKVSNYPSAGKDTYFIFDGFQQTRNTAIPGNWPNNMPNNQWTLSDFPPIELNSTYTSRSRYESNLSPITVVWSYQSTPFQYNFAGAQSSAWIAANNVSYDWTNKDIYFHYTFVFVLTWLPGNPQVNINYIARLNPCDYETTPTPYGSLLTDIEILGVTPLSSTPISGIFCKNDYDYLQVNIYGTSGIPDGTMMATIDFQPYGVGNIKEEDLPSTSPFFIMPQLSCVEIYDVQNMTSGVSSFKIDLAQLPTNQDIQICGIYIPL